MLKALYYPHTEVGSQTVLKNALLLWDALETIVPRAPKPSPHGPKNALLQEAASLVVRPRRPNDKERQEAHKALEAMLHSGQLAAVLAKAPNAWREGRYLIYPDKFLHETWRMLETEGLGRLEARHQDYGVPSALGFLMMSLLADSCAGTQIQKVTDRTDAYSWLAEAHAAVLGATHVLGLDASQVAPPTTGSCRSPSMCSTPARFHWRGCWRSGSARPRAAARTTRRCAVGISQRWTRTSSA